MDFPRTIDEITPEWLTQVLRENGAISDAVVTSHRFENLDGQGNWSEIRRLVPEYSKPESGGPRSMIVKIGINIEGSEQNPTLHREIAVVNEREVRFYQDFAAECGLNTPKNYFSAYDPETAEAIYLLEDSGHLKTIDKADSCSLDDGRAALLSLANMHRTWWDSEQVGKQLWLRNYGANIPPKLAQEWFEQRIDSFFEMGGDSVPKGLESIARKFLPKLIEVAAEVATAPVTLSHGDYQPTNMFFDDSQDIENRVVVFDWQTAGRVRCSEDVSSFIASGFDVASRREYEQQLLAEYHSVLLDGGVTGYSYDEFQNDFRLSLLLNMVKRINSTVRNIEASQRNEEILAHEMGIAERLQVVVDWNCDEVIPK
jgi:hypothetical protein